MWCWGGEGCDANQCFIATVTVMARAPERISLGGSDRGARMKLGMPKPLHGWRVLAGEVGVIVLGVLIGSWVP